LADCHSGGRPPKDDRLNVTAIWYILRTGVPWRDLPARFGPWSSVYSRFRRCCASGLWSRLVALLGNKAYGRIRSIDCSHIKVHQDGANPSGGQAAQAIGRTKGGLNTKLAAVVDSIGRAVGLNLAPGRNTICAPVPRSCRSSTASGSSAIEDSTLTGSGRILPARARSCASRRGALGASPSISIAHSIGIVIRSKTSSAESNATAGLAPAMTN